MELVLSRLENQTLEAYKTWLTNFIKAATGETPTFTEERWVESWKKYWGQEQPKR